MSGIFKDKDTGDVTIDLSGSFSSPSTLRNTNTVVEYKDDERTSVAEVVEKSVRTDNGTHLSVHNDILHKSITVDVGLAGINANDIVPMQFDPYLLANLNQKSTVRAKCIEAIATNVVNLGYKIRKFDPNIENTDGRDPISEKIGDKLESWAEIGDMTFTEMMYRVKYDEESTGNGYIEVLRTPKGVISGLKHVPSTTIRILKPKPGQKYTYVQGQGNNKRYFYKFGDKVNKNSEGSPTSIRKNIPNAMDNELIHFKIYSTNSSYYGEPRDIGSFVTLAGDEMAQNHNIKFFTNSATPEIMMIFSVDKSALPPGFVDQNIKLNIPDSVKESIYNHFRKTIPSASNEPGLLYLPHGVTCKIEKLSQGQRDAGWVTYRKDNRGEIRMAFRVPPVIIGDTSDTGYATAQVEKSIFLEQVVAPEQRRYQSLIMRLLWPEMTDIKAADETITVDESGEVTKKPPIAVSPTEGKGVNRHLWRLEFKQLSTQDKISEAQIDNIYLDKQIVTRNEVREKLEMRPIKGLDVFLQKQQAPSTATTPDPNDIRGLAGREGGGRGPNGTMTIPPPRRPSDDNTREASNFDRVGIPLKKNDDGTESVSKTDLLKDTPKDLLDFLEDD